MNAPRRARIEPLVQWDEERRRFHAFRDAQEVSQACDDFFRRRGMDIYQIKLTPTETNDNAEQPT